MKITAKDYLKDKGVIFEALGGSKVNRVSVVDLMEGYAEAKLKESAAPDMLEALEAMLSRFKGCDIGMIKSNHVKAQAEAAIAKAKLNKECPNCGANEKESIDCIQCKSGGHPES